MALNDKDGITLTELLVASILIGIVMMGVVSFSVAIKQLQDSSNKSTILAMRTTTAMHQIKNDATLAIGDNENCGRVNGDIPWNIDCGWGIRTHQAGELQKICFRQDRLATPENYADDTWVCYHHGNSYGLQHCKNINKDDVPTYTWAQCKASGYRTITSLAKPEGIIFFNVQTDADGRFDYIEIDLMTRYTYDKPTHPINNPEYRLKSRIRPLGHSN